MNLFWLKLHTPWFLLTGNKCSSCVFWTEVTENSTSFIVWQQTAHAVSLWTCACLREPSGGFCDCLGCVCNKEHSAPLFILFFLPNPNITSYQLFELLRWFWQYQSKFTNFHHLSLYLSLHYPSFVAAGGGRWSSDPPPGSPPVVHRPDFRT